MYYIIFETYISANEKSNLIGWQPMCSLEQYFQFEQNNSIIGTIFLCFVVNKKCVQSIISYNIVIS